MADFLHRFRRLEQTRQSIVCNHVFGRHEFMVVGNSVVVRRQKAFPELILMDGD